MDVLKYIFVSFVSFTALTGCQIGYYFSSAYNQVSMLTSQVPISKALQDPSLTEQEKEKLKLALKVREFASHDLHLTSTSNYTSFVKLDRPYATYVVSAAPKWELKHHLWKYPFVGEMPYKGFFDEESAHEEEASLKQEDLDTYLRGVSAYSTLGWLKDPVLSTMFRYTDYEFVNTLIHETVHTTIFIRNSADFNERLAVFLGNKGMELYYLKEEGPDSKTLKIVQAENHDDRVFSKFISEEMDKLSEWYKSQKTHAEEARQQRIKEIQARFEREIEPQMQTHIYNKFKSMSLNNARLMLYKTYMEDLSDFEALYDKEGRDFSKFLATCRSLESDPKPEEGLKKLIKSIPTGT